MGQAGVGGRAGPPLLPDLNGDTTSAGPRRVGRALAEPKAAQSSPCRCRLLCAASASIGISRPCDAHPSRAGACSVLRSCATDLVCPAVVRGGGVPSGVDQPRRLLSRGAGPGMCDELALLDLDVRNGRAAQTWRVGGGVRSGTEHAKPLPAGASRAPAAPRTSVTLLWASASVR